MGFSGPAVDEQDGIELIRSAVDLGIIFDTAQVYGPSSNEPLVGQALAPVRNQVVIATKFGFSFDGSSSTGLDSGPEHIRSTGKDSLAPDEHGEHRPALPTPRRPRGSDRGGTGTVKELIAAGKVAHFSLSKAGVAIIRRARAVRPLTALQANTPCCGGNPKP